MDAVFAGAAGVGIGGVESEFVTLRGVLTNTRNECKCRLVSTGGGFGFIRVQWILWRDPGRLLLLLFSVLALHNPTFSSSSSSALAMNNLSNLKKLLGSLFLLHPGSAVALGVHLSVLCASFR